MKRTVLVVAVLGLVALTGGCVGRVLKEGTGVVLGAKANVIEIEPLGRGRDLGPVTIGAMDNAMGRPVTSDWLVALTAELRRHVVAEKELAAGRQAVKLSGVVVHLEGAGLTDQAFGPAPEVIVRMTVTDAATGQTLGVANVVGRARGTTSSSQEDLTKAFAEGVAKWLRNASKGHH